MKDEKSLGKDGDFSKELSAIAAPQPIPAVNPVADKPVPEKAVGLDASKKFALASSAERAPTTRTPAASLNAAAAITGLKPWSREWVFEGNDPIAQAQGARGKPLFGEGSEDTQVLDAAAAAAINPAAMKGVAQPGGKRGDAGATSVQTSTDAGAARITGQQAGVAVKGASALDATPDVSSLLQQHRAAAQSAQAAGAATSAGEAVLLPGLAALNGEVLAASGAEHMSGGSQNMSTQPTQLSGAEFMSALAATRMGVRGNDSSNLSGNLSGDTGQGGGFGGQAGKANFRAVDAIKKPASLPGREDLVLLAGVEPLRTGDYHVIQPAQVEGRVTQGAMTRNRLTSESLLNMTNGIGGFAAQGGGEMRVRLKPDSLGELHVRVSTRGNDVRLQIQATDDKAMRILEESLPHLKDKLASQNLNLGRVEVSTLAQHVSGSGLRPDVHGDHGDQGQNQSSMYQQHSMNDWLGQDQQGRSGGSPNQWRDYDSVWETDLRSPRPVGPSTAGLTAAASSARSSELEPGRLDVRA